MEQNSRKKIHLILLLTICLSVGLQFGTIQTAIGVSPTPRIAGSPSTSPKNYTWGTGFDDTSYAATSTDNAIYVTGDAYGPLGGADIFLARFDTTGELNLLKWWGGTGSESGAGVGIDHLGNIYVVGATQSFGYFWRQVEFIKYDPDGILLWNTTWGDSGDEYVGDAFVGSDGIIYAAGTDVSGSDDAMLIKCSSSGEVLWNKTFGGSGNEYGQAVIVDGERNVFLAGTTTSWGAGGEDVFLVKYDKNGVKIFNQTWGGPGDEFAYDMCIESSGEITITGYSQSWTIGGLPDVLLLHYTANGTLAWNRTWGGPGADNAWGILAEWDGSYLITGNSESSGGLGRNVLLANFGSTGELLWNITWSGTGNTWEEGTAIMRLGNQVAISGFTAAGAPYDILILLYDMPLPLGFYTPLWITLGAIAAVTIFILILVKRKRK